MAESASDGLHDVATALDALLAAIEPLAGEWVTIQAASGRVLAESLTARLDTPPADNSAMDGYALRAADAGQVLPVSQRIPAGHAPEPLASGSCARIFTGALLPEGADSICRQEVVEAHEAGVFIPAPLSVGNSVRSRGREMRQGDVLLERGERLDAAGLGFLASQGFDRLPVRRQPRIAVIATGDELVAPGQPLAPGQIYNSNALMIAELMRDFGGEVVLNAHAEDRLDATVELLARAAECADVVVTSGGVSIGEEDHVREALAQLGQLDLWRLSIKPGKPLALGRLQRRDGSQARFVGLAGNPVSSYVGAWLFLRPLMAALLACPALERLPALRVRAEFETQTERRANYMRVSLAFDGDALVARAFADQDSSILRSCVHADALAVIPAHCHVRPGDIVDALRLSP